MRYSHQRERIFRAVSERCDHPTANMVYEQLKLEMPRLSLGTVYRNLNQLADAGRLKKIPLADGSCRFDKTKEAHSHIVCDECGDRPATRMCALCAWEGEGWLCETCAELHVCDDDDGPYFLPLVNSPRAGVCAYTGE